MSSCTYILCALAEASDTSIEVRQKEEEDGFMKIFKCIHSSEELGKGGLLASNETLNYFGVM
jgi:hypothetical protein